MRAPEGYRLIAHSELRHSTTKVYYNSDVELFALVVDGDKMSFYTKCQLESLSHAAADVLTMRGNLNYLD